MSKRRLRIAIVDDEPSVRTALARLLNAYSFEVRTYESGREFITSLSHEAPECLVVDIQMPEFTGLDLLRYLSGNQKRIPAIAITAFDDTEVRNRCTEFGASAFLIKPFHAHVLIDSINSAAAQGNEIGQ